MAATPTTYKGNNAVIAITADSSPLTHSTLAISDFSLTFDRGTVEQELVGEDGNLFLAGSMSIEGSLTSCKLYTGALADIIGRMVNNENVKISGSCGANSLHFYFQSCQVTGFDFSIGDADTISEGSIDFTLLHPYEVTKTQKDGSGTFLNDY